ncbi:hypothetical protein BC826DRAFT_1023278 [Russula brevipes]|nr:hypothetical protein BC826DRAFT_1023278 [Russula brevipes]
MWMSPCASAILIWLVGPASQRPIVPSATRARGRPHMRYYGRRARCASVVPWGLCFAPLSLHSRCGAFPAP